MKLVLRAANSIHGLFLFFGLMLPLTVYFARTAALGRFDFSILSEPAVVQAISNSILLAFTTAVTSTSTAFVFSWLFWRYRWNEKFSKFATILLKLPYLLPPFFFAMGWIALAAPQVGYINRFLSAAGLPTLPPIYGLVGTALVLTLWAIAMAMIQLQSLFAQLPGQLEDAALLCGASPWQTFWRITVAVSRPQLTSCALLTGANALAAFGVPAMLASPERRYVITTRIVQAIKSGEGATGFQQIAVLSTGLLAITFALLALQKLFERKSLTLVSGKAVRPAQLKPPFAAKLLFAAAFAFGIFSSLLPFLALLAQSFLRDRSDLTSWTFEKYVYVFSKIPDTLLAFKNSIITALAAALLATALGLLLAFGAARAKNRVSRLMIEAWNVGYALPGTVIALALLVCYTGSLSDTLWILAIAYVVKYSAFALRTITPAMGAISPELEEAASMSGASPGQAFALILVPILKTTILAAAMLAFVPMLSELTMSILLVGPGTDTLGSLIYRLQDYADPGSAAVLAVTVTLAILVINRRIKLL